MSVTAPTVPALSLHRVMNAMLGAVGGWIVSTLLRRDVGQLLGQRILAVQAMWQRYEAGTLRRRGPRKLAVAGAEIPMQPVDSAAAMTEASTMAKPPRAAGMRLPHKFGWLLTHLAYRAAPHRLQLTELLQQPGFDAFLVAYPNVARRLRPICRALAIDTRLLQLPRKPRVPRQRKPNIRKPSYVDYEYRDWKPGDHWVQRVNKYGTRFVWLKDSVVRNCDWFVPNKKR